MNSGERPIATRSSPAKKGRGAHPNSLANLRPASRFTPENAREFAKRSHAARRENELRGERPSKRASRMQRIFARAEKIVEDALAGRGTISPQRLSAALAVLKLRGTEPAEPRRDLRIVWQEIPGRGTEPAGQAEPLRIEYARPAWARGGDADGEAVAEANVLRIPRGTGRVNESGETGAAEPPPRAEPAPPRRNPVCEVPAGQVDAPILAYVKGRP